MRYNNPSVSVVIPTCGYNQHLCEQIDALARQDYMGRVEIVVADNVGDPRLAAYVQERDRDHNPPIGYVAAAQHTGAAHARNEGARSATHDLLVFCDADDVVRSSWISGLTELAQSADVVGTAVDPTRINSKRALKWTPTLTPTEQGKSTFLPFAIGASMGCWKSVYQALGGMDNRFRASEDVEFSWRAQLEGYTFAFDTEMRVDYRLRDRVRPLVTQSLRLGYGSTKLIGTYRSRGCPPVQLSKTLLGWAELVIRNPALPVVVTRLPRGLWLRAVALRAGSFRAGLRYHAFNW